MNFYTLFLLAVLAQTPVENRRYEGDWYINDVTDNVTGERDVDAMQLHVEADDPDFVTIRMRCLAGKPTLLVEWAEQSFPDQTVLTIAASFPDRDGTEKGFIFEKSTDPVNSGLKASPVNSQAVVTAIGKAKYVTITARPASGTRSVGLKVDGTQQAWERVSRHCPVRITPVPAA